MAFLASKYSLNIVLSAAFMTLGITITLTLYAYFTKADFTTCGAMITCMIVLVGLLGMFCLFYKSSALTLVYCGLGLALFSLWLVIDS